MIHISENVKDLTCRLRVMFCRMITNLTIVTHFCFMCDAEYVLIAFVQAWMDGTSAIEFDAEQSSQPIRISGTVCVRKCSGNDRFCVSRIDGMSDGSCE